MKTQFGAGSDIAIVTANTGRVIKSSGLTEGAVQPVASSGAMGEKKSSPDSEPKKQEPENPLTSETARLTIEHDQDSGKFIYKTIDRETGEVIKQWPREEVLKAISAYQAASGLIIDKLV